MGHRWTRLGWDRLQSDLSIRKLAASSVLYSFQRIRLRRPDVQGEMQKKMQRGQGEASATSDYKLGEVDKQQSETAGDAISGTTSTWFRRKIQRDVGLGGGRQDTLFVSAGGWEDHSEIELGAGWWEENFFFRFEALRSGVECETGTYYV